MVFAEDTQWLLPLDQSEEVISDRLPVEEVVHAQQEVPEGRGGAGLGHHGNAARSTSTPTRSRNHKV